MFPFSAKNFNEFIKSPYFFSLNSLLAIAVFRIFDKAIVFPPYALLRYIFSINVGSESFCILAQSAAHMLFQIVVEYENLSNHFSDSSTSISVPIPSLYITATWYWHFPFPSLAPLRYCSKAPSSFFGTSLPCRYMSANRMIEGRNPISLAFFRFFSISS